MTKGSQFKIYFYRPEALPAAAEQRVPCNNAQR